MKECAHASEIQRLAQLRQRLEQALKQQGLSNQQSQDVAFHLLDWIEDLCTLYHLYEEMSHKSDAEICQAITDFLVHVPPHLNAAKFLYGLGEVEDVFDLGIVPEKMKGSPQLRKRRGWHG